MNNNDSGIKPDMTEEEQMQVRKDLGLYYEETTTEEKEARYRNQSESLTLQGFAKISDDIPGKDDIIAIEYDGDDFSNFVTGDIPYKDGYLISLDGDVFFIVVKSKSVGSNPGIYINFDYHAETVSLKYYGPVTTVSKVPERFLPVAWNQLVTEGTKIAEVTIGEKTTEVFAPEGGGASVLELIAPLAIGYNVDVETAYGISAESIKDIFDGKVVALHYSNTLLNERVVYILKSAYVNGSNGKAVFVDKDGKTYTISGSYNNTIKIIYLGNSTAAGPIELTELPTASMTTTAELEAIGLDYQMIYDASLGRKTGISYVQGSSSNEHRYFFPLTAEYQTSGGQSVWTLEFDFDGNHYKIVVSYVVMFEVTVTVTPLT